MGKCEEKTKNRRKIGKPLDTRIASFMIFAEYTKGFYSSPLSQQINIIAKCYFFLFISINRDSLQIQKRNTRFMMLKSNFRVFSFILPCDLFSFSFLQKPLPYCDSHFNLLALSEILLIIYNTIFPSFFFFIYSMLIHYIFFASHASIVTTFFYHFLLRYIGISELKKIILFLNLITLRISFFIFYFRESFIIYVIIYYIIYIIIL